MNSIKVNLVGKDGFCPNSQGFPNISTLVSQIALSLYMQLVLAKLNNVDGSVAGVVKANIVELLNAQTEVWCIVPL